MGNGWAKTQGPHHIQSVMNYCSQAFKAKSVAERSSIATSKVQTCKFLCAEVKTDKFTIRCSQAVQSVLHKLIFGRNCQSSVAEQITSAKSKVQRATCKVPTCKVKARKRVNIKGNTPKFTASCNHTVQVT